MSTVNCFNVTFENNQEEYQAGQVVRGHVEVDLKADMATRGINVTLKGSSRCRFFANRMVYTGREIYFNHTITLWGPGQITSGGHPVLSAGRHSFPVEYQLPSTGLPTSFEGAAGHVRYRAKATIDRPRGFNKTARKNFTVLDKFDINPEDPGAMKPSSVEKSKRLGFGPFASAPIEVRVQTDRGAYRPGETIRLSGSLTNGSGVDIRETTVQIRQRLSYLVTCPHKFARSDRETLSEMRTLGCRGRDTADLGAITVQIPDIAPTPQRFCQVIQVAHKVKFIVHIPGPHINLKVSVPITIGSIPAQGLYPAL